MSKTKRRPKTTHGHLDESGATGDVLTLAEAAAYLRVLEEEVLRMVREQDLPARQVGTQWRFLKSAVEAWLGQRSSSAKSKGIWAAAGSWKNDPYLDELLKEIYRRRGRSIAEER
jgi:excisionase family DNA binding protein